MIVGIDPSSRKLVAVIGRLGSPVPSLQVHAKKLGDHSIVSRSAHASNWAVAMLALAFEMGGDVYVGVESPVLGRGGAAATIQQAIVHGALLGVFGNHDGTEALQVNNSRWKKQTVGKGNAGKPEILAWAKREHPDYVARTASTRGTPDQDAIDALGVWHSVNITVRNQRAIEKIQTMRVNRERTKGMQ